MFKQRLRTNYARLKNLAIYHNLDPIDYYVSSGHRVVYIENAKVGCSSIKWALFGREIAEGDCDRDIHEEALRWRYRKLSDVCREFLVFTFVRNPFDRLVSCYEDKVKKRAVSPQNVYRLRFYRALFWSFGGIDIWADGLLFDDFARAVSRIPDWLSDRHFRSQYATIYAGDNVHPKIIGKFERFKEDWEKIMWTCSLPELPLRNTSERNEWQKYYTDIGVVRAIARRYWKDIVAFDYLHEYERIKERVES